MAVFPELDATGACDITVEIAQLTTGEWMGSIDTEPVATGSSVADLLDCLKHYVDQLPTRCVRCHVRYQPTPQA